MSKRLVLASLCLLLVAGCTARPQATPTPGRVPVKLAMGYIPNV